LPPDVKDSCKRVKLFHSVQATDHEKWLTENTQLSQNQHKDSMAYLFGLYEKDKPKTTKVPTLAKLLALSGDIEIVMGL